jgi:hypothetical protein
MFQTMIVLDTLMQTATQSMALIKSVTKMFKVLTASTKDVSYYQLVMLTCEADELED